MVQNEYWMHLYKNAKFSANTEIEKFLQLLPSRRECGLVKFKEKKVWDKCALQQITVRRKGNENSN